MNKADTGRVKKSVRGLMLVATVAALLMAACTQDETVGDGTALPEGAYPLEIASVGMSATGSQRPWTRVAESEDGNSSEWEGGEIIHLLFNGQETTYKIAADKKTLELEGEQLYWKSTDAQTITAWYPTDGTVNLADQSQNLAYVLTGSGTGDYKKAVELSFSHALAKVRVVFSDESTADLTDASVSILAPTTCTVNKGNVTAGTTTAYIPMRKTSYNGKVCYEANVPPPTTY